jgi:hypothetical protein
MSKIELKLDVDVMERKVRHAREERPTGQFGNIRLDASDQRVIAVFIDWLREGKLEKQKELAALGSLLYRVLFDEQTDQALNLALQAAGSERLRLRLCFSNDDLGLVDWPWEFLFYPGSQAERNYFFATHPKVTLSRCKNLARTQDVLNPENEALRVLFVITEGKGLGDDGSDLGPVPSKPVIDAIGEIAQRQTILYKVLNNPGYDGLRDQLVSQKPHVLHFIGHGRYELDQKVGKIGLLHEKGRCDWYEADVVGLLFDDFKGVFSGAAKAAPPQVVVLQLVKPNAIAPDSRASFRALADQLTLIGVPAVVAMQYPIPPDPAVAFSRVFYEELAKGDTVDSAVQKARTRLASYPPPDPSEKRVFGTPLLYVQNTSNGIVQPLTAGGQGPTPSMGAASAAPVR